QVATTSIEMATSLFAGLPSRRSLRTRKVRELRESRKAPRYRRLITLLNCPSLKTPVRVPYRVSLSRRRKLSHVDPEKFRVRNARRQLASSRDFLDCVYRSWRSFSITRSCWESVMLVPEGRQIPRSNKSWETDAECGK